MQDNPSLLSIGKASEYLGVSVDTLRRWEKRGRLNTYRSPGGHRYFKKQELDQVFGMKYTRDEILNEHIKPVQNEVVEQVEPEIQRFGPLRVETIEEPFYIPPQATKPLQKQELPSISEMFEQEETRQKPTAFILFGIFVIADIILLLVYIVTRYLF